MNNYSPSPERYQNISFRRCGNSGLALPLLSLGLWHNFGSVDVYENSRAMARCAFDLGITHFDLANNYGPEPGSAESNFGKILRNEFRSHRDELIISSKAGYIMWDGPYGRGGSRKSLIASCDQSLKRMGIDYVDIFYHHCPDADAPLEESMTALDHIVRSGRALYAGISNYPPQLAQQAARILQDLKTPCLIHQIRFNILNQENIKNGTLETDIKCGMGTIVFSPMAQGLLSNRYLSGTVAPDSRAARAHFLKPETITPALLKKLNALDCIAEKRGQTLAQMAVAWVLAQNSVTSALIGASCKEQIIDIAKGVNCTKFSAEELSAINSIAARTE